MVPTRDEQERIEIELTPREPSSHDRSDALVARPIGAPGRSSDGRRVLATAAVVGVVGLGVGFVAGRSSGERGVTGAAAATTTPREVPTTGSIDPVASVPRPATISTVTPATTTPPLRTLPASRSAADTTPSESASAGSANGSRQVLPTTPGLAGEPVTGSLPVDPVVAGQPVEVVGVTVRRALVRLDLATGRTELRPVDRSPTGPPTVYAGQDWIALPSWGEPQEWTIVHDDGTTSSSPLGGVVAALHTPGSDRFWQFDPAEPTPTVTEVGLDGVPTGRTIDLPGFPDFADPNGDGVAVSVPGGSYLVGSDAPRRITPGRLIALGGERALALECDAALQCGHVVIDRRTGERRELALDPALGDGASIRTAASWAGRAPFNRAEDAALMVTYDQFGGGREAGGVLDLETGELLEITERGDAAMMHWMPDGRSVLWLDSGELNVFDVTTRTSTVVAPGLDRLIGFAVRAIVPSLDGGAAVTPTTTG